MDSQQCLWFSRLSFGVSLVALVTAFAGACQKPAPEVSPEQSRVGVALAHPAAPPAETKPETTQGSGAAQPTVRDESVRGDRATPEAAAASAAPPSTAAPVDGAKVSDESDVRRTPTAAVPLQLERLVVTHAIDEREPAAVDAITIGERPVIAFIELKNPDEQAQRVVVTFEPKEGGEKVGFIELEVPGKAPRWRTWGNTQRVTRPGQWVAVVSSEGGEELGRTEFRVSDPT